MEASQNNTASLEDERLQKLEEVSSAVMDILIEFRKKYPDITEEMLMRNMAFDIGVFIANVHKHWFRANRYNTLDAYQSFMKAGMEAGVKTWSKPQPEGE